MGFRNKCIAAAIRSSFIDKKNYLMSRDVEGKALEKKWAARESPYYPDIDGLPSSFLNCSLLSHVLHYAVFRNRGTINHS